MQQRQMGVRLLLLGAFGGLCLPPAAARRGRPMPAEFEHQQKTDEHGIDLSAHGRDKASDAQRSMVPDKRKPESARMLRCSICVVLVHELCRALPKFKKRLPKQYEVAEAMDDICLEFENYGLQMEHNTPTHRYSSDAEITMHRGGWIETYGVTTCGDLLEDHEDALVAAVHSRLGQLRAHHNSVVDFCEQHRGLCRVEEREKLGDWDSDGNSGTMLSEDEYLTKPRPVSDISMGGGKDPGGL